MITFSKAQIASILATGIDFLVALMLFRLLGTSKSSPGIMSTIAGGTGTICGGIFHFLISRHWVFQAREKSWSDQVSRYALVWVGNLLLNISLLFLLTNYTGMNFLAAKIVVAVGIAIFYNYILQKRFVFK